MLYRTTVGDNNFEMQCTRREGEGEGRRRYIFCTEQQAPRRREREMIVLHAILTLLPLAMLVRRPVFVGVVVESTSLEPFRSHSRGEKQKTQFGAALRST